MIRDRPAQEIEITMEMISVGLAAYRDFDPEVDEPEALVFAILYRAHHSRRDYPDSLMTRSNSTTSGDDVRN